MLRGRPVANQQPRKRGRASPPPLGVPGCCGFRAEARGKPLRVRSKLDPRRAAILLIGGDKAGNARFSDRMIPVADALYDARLAELEKENERGG